MKEHQSHVGPRQRSTWLWAAILVQDKGHVEVHIRQHQGHVGTNINVELEGHVRVDIKVMLGQDEGRSRCRPCCGPCWPTLGPCWGRHQSQVGRAMLGPTSKSCLVGPTRRSVEIKTMLGSTLANIRAMLGPTSKSSWEGHVRADIKVLSCCHVGANLKVKLEGPC